MKRLSLAVIAVLMPLKSALAQDLLETYQLAVQNDPEYKISDITRLSTAEIKSQSIAQMLPNIGFGASSTRSRLDSRSFLGSTLQHFWDQKLGYNLKQPVFHWDHWIQLDQSENQIAQAEANYQAKQQALMRRCAEAYFNILSAQDNLDFVNAERTAIAQQQEQAKQRFEVGLIAITDVYEAKAGYDRTEANLIEAQNLLDNSKEALREILGDNPANLNRLQNTISLVPPSPADINAWTAAAESSNFSVVAQINQAEYMRKMVDFQQARHLPTLDIIAQYNEQDSGNRYGLRGDSENIGLQVNVPLFEGGGTSSRVRQAEHEFNAAKQELIRTQRSVTRMVKDAFRGIEASISRVKALDATVSSAEKSLEATSVGLEVGTRTMVEVLTEQRNLYKAKSDYARSRYDYLINTIRLKEANGSLSEVDLAQINQFLK